MVLRALFKKKLRFLIGIQAWNRDSDNLYEFSARERIDLRVQPT